MWEIVEPPKAVELPQKDQCEGLVFRCVSSQFAYEDRKGRTVWGERTFMRQLKKESCEGCSKCLNMLGALKEFSSDSDVSVRPTLEHGAKYKLQGVDISHDYETGICDDWGLAFIKIEE